MVTLNQLRAIYTLAPLARLQEALPYLQDISVQFEINTRLRVAAFLAQVGHECKEFLYSEEIASGTAYEGRADLGNTQPGDGPKFKGRGWIQLTGRANYTEFKKYFGVDVVINPGLVAQYPYKALAAGWFWQENGINRIADSGNIDHVSDKVNRGRITAAVGDSNGYADRVKYYTRALDVLPLDFDPLDTVPAEKKNSWPALQIASLQTPVIIIGLLMVGGLMWKKYKTLYEN